MAIDKSNLDSAADEIEEVKPSRAKKAIKTGAVLAAVGLAALAIRKGMKTRAGKAAVKKAKTKAKSAVRKTVRKVKAKARAGAKRATAGAKRKTASR